MTGTADHDLRGQRARYCYHDVAAWHQRWQTEATTRVKGIPIEIRAQGLMVTLAVLMADGRESGRSSRMESARHLAEVLAQWLLAEAPYRTLTGPAPQAQPSPAALLEACAKASRGDYAAAEREAILLFDQIKIYAGALYADGAGGSRD